MARLRANASSGEWLLASSSMIGRSSSCLVRLDDPTVSTRHALLTWRDGIWELQDLHSRNGTYVNGALLPGGERVGLEQGAQLSFGTQERSYVLANASWPSPYAVRLGTPSQFIEFSDGMLALPPTQPELLILRKDGQWWMERPDTVEPVRDAQLVSTRAGSYRLRLPEEVLPTQTADDAALLLSSLQLQLEQCSDSTVEARMVRGTQRIELGVRAYHTPMIALARQRLASSGAPELEQGWIDQDELLRRLGYPSNRLHVDIHRCRRQLARAGVVDATRLIERRPHGRQLRLGVSNIEFIDIR